MNDEFRSFRILLLPLGLFIVFFLITPRMCARAVTKVKEQEVTKTATDTGAPVTGLQIEQAPPTGLGSGKAAPKFPPGLDAARIQYLVEIDRQFSEPKRATLPKKFDEKDVVQKAMLKLQYAEKLADGTISITRDGHINMSGITEQAEGWSFPVAKRVFDNVDFIDRVEDDRYRATIRWHWQPDVVGTEMGIDTKAYAATAEFAGGERSWVLVGWKVPPVEPEKKP